MNPTLRNVLRDGLVRVARHMATSIGARVTRGEGIDVPLLSTVDDSPGATTDAPPREPGKARPVQPPPGWDGSIESGDGTDGTDRDARRVARDDDGVASPGQLGPAATVEVGQDALRGVELAWSPELDGDPDPGEVIWTWVPYEEADGRGKDRPVLVLGREAAGTVLAVYLSSRPHGSESGWERLGAGGWDHEARESWANLHRVLRVHPDGMRREGDLTDRGDFDRIVHRLQGRR